MPGRSSGRSARSSTATLPRKSSTATLKSGRGSASARTSAYAVEVPDEGPVTSLRTQICLIFADAQKSTAMHRKLVINLRKIQEACCYEPADPKKKSGKGRAEEEDFGEAEFNEEVRRCILRVMMIKKSEPVGDRIMRFLGLFLKHATEKDNLIYQPEGEEMTAFPETPSSRLTSHILSTVLAFLTVKDKTVRFRASQTVAHIVNNLDQIDDELFNLIRLGLLKRLRDKEPAVRVQAVLGLGRLAENDDEDNDDEDSDDDAAGGILVKLLDIMQNDPSADVRRAVLMNLPFRPMTLKWLLERARDMDPATRRALYGKLLPALGDFRHMSLIEREKLLRWGLRDRDEIVRKATARLFRERWIEDCASTANPVNEEEKKPGDVAPPNMDALLELLERIDVTHSGVEEGMAHDAMREFWDGRPDYRDFVTFDDDYWNDLHPEHAFVVRSLNDYCRNADDDRLQDTIESKMPTLKEFAFFINKYLNDLVEVVRKSASAEEEDPTLLEDEEALIFTVEQLLHIALTLDYTDEVGRRQIFRIMREALALPELPEECTRLAVEVLRTVCGSREAGEREFCSIVLEAIAEVRDTLVDDDAAEQNANESFHSAQSEISDESATIAKKKAPGEEEDAEALEERQYKELLVYIKCLHIAQCMLQNVHSDLEKNDALVTMLNTLVVPACRSHDAVVRERGLCCLGLCGLLSKNLATSNFQLFLHCFTQGHEALQIIAIQVLTDIVITHPSLLSPPPADPNTSTDSSAAPAVNPLLKPLTKAFLKAFSSSKELSLMACTAASKLLLLGVLPQHSATDILKTFTLAYFNPETVSNPALRQALSYFLPVFCHSSLKNALLMSQICVPIISKLLIMREELDDEDEEMVGWTVVAAHLAEWTDGRKVFGATELSTDGSGKMEIAPSAEEPHIVLATEILERALGNACSKDERKPLLQVIGKLHISAAAPNSMKEEVFVNEESLRTLHALASEAVESRLGGDATARNTLAKLEITLTKRIGEVEHVVQGQDPDGQSQTEADVSASATPDADIDNMEVPDEGETVITVAPAIGEEEEEDTLLAGMHAEGTRIPLEAEDEDESTETESTTQVTVPAARSGRRNVRETLTESDIIDSLLESEI
ncbi:uncharacterized protein BDR25DRAFT_335693 [Lindgomyces ingoldianus]|uniref:Uncharacterized protein n=1 Tax=Lindgomyces ingoldianus TaxID=673940 RepID=A0ACB6QLL8_9PLEO|nr:uncharacterized protein BDR25DRAFT_335693 [Lindgomyces ingoldianus]KAF2467838.1 hypothetical protein BDR25DRAFT_335693 [Lindgomyces ingoldianus]